MHTHLEYTHKLRINLTKEVKDLDDTLMKNLKKMLNGGNLSHVHELEELVLSECTYYPK
jgi:hypothetical protein